MGLKTAICPLFSLSPVPWIPPDSGLFDALMLTSANAVLMGGTGLDQLQSLPVLAVGTATAEAARAAGFTVVHTGSGTAQNLADDTICAKYRTILRLVGTSPAPATLKMGAIEMLQTYAAAPLSPPLTCANGAIVLLHSTKAAKRFSSLFTGDRQSVDVVAISNAVAAAAGPGWRSVHVSAQPDDAAMLALAQNLCEQSAS
jgi:uroporphyrinogen-III synthase